MKSLLGIVLGLSAIFSGVVLEGGHIWLIVEFPDLSWILAMLIGFLITILPIRGFLKTLRNNWGQLAPLLGKVSLICGLILFCVQLIVVFENLDAISKSMKILGYTISPVTTSLILAYVFSRFSKNSKSTPQFSSSGGNPWVGSSVMIVASIIYLIGIGFHFSSIIQVTAFIIVLGVALMGWLCSERSQKWLSIIDSGAWSALLGSLFGAAHFLEHFDKLEMMGPGLAISLVAVVYGGFATFVGSGLTIRFEGEPHTTMKALSRSINKLYISVAILIGMVALTLSSLALGYMK